MCRLEDPVLMGPELLEFSLEKLILMAGDGLLIENKHVGDVVVVHLILLAIFNLGD